MALVSALQCGPPKWNLRRVAIAALLAVAFAPPWAAAAQDWSARAATTIVDSQPSPAGAWDTETGLRLLALRAEWYNTARGEYFRYVRNVVDSVLARPGWYATPRSPFANALLGQQLMLLYRVTLKPSYYVAARDLRHRLAPSCGLGSDSADAAPPLPQANGRCVAQAFLAEYAAEFQRPQDFPALARSYQESYRDRSAHPAVASSFGETGSEGPLYPMAWAALSLVDSLPSYPDGQPSRAQALAALRGIAAQWLRHRDSYSSLPQTATSRSSNDWLLAYALLKAVRLHYLPAPDRAVAMSDWSNRLPSVRAGSGGGMAFTSPSAQASLGAFLLASTEVDLARGSGAGRGAAILLDAWYNSQQRKNAAGQLESFHYKWNDFSDSGYSLFGHMLRSSGLRTQTLAAAPTPEGLAGAAYYLIVSPDIPVKNPQPHYMTTADADVIAAWVRRGGVLILMENDPPNADIEHLNLLADRFGIHFDDVLHHHVPGEDVENGRVAVAAGGLLFHRSHTLYMKDTCAISLRGSATALLRDRGDVVMATARYGRGAVFAAVDPWLYNEYTDGRKKPAALYRQFDNFAAGKELTRWLVKRRPPTQLPEKQKGKQ